MDNLSWSKEYENVSSDKLRLFGVVVLAELGNGVRIVQPYGGTVLIINIPKEMDKLELRDGYEYYKYHAELDLHEVGRNEYVYTNNRILTTYTALVFDESGNIAIDETDLQNVVEEKDSFLKEHVNVAKKALDYLEKRINKMVYQYRALSHAPEIQTHYDSYMGVTRLGNKGRYLLVDFTYDYTRGAMLLYDIKERRTIIKSTTSEVRLFMLGSKDKKPMKNKMAVSFMTKDLAMVMLEDSEIGALLKVDSLTKIQNRYKNEIAFLNDLKRDCNNIDNDLEEAINYELSLQNLCIIQDRLLFSI